MLERTIGPVRRGRCLEGAVADPRAHSWQRNIGMKLNIRALWLFIALLVPVAATAQQRGSAPNAELRKQVQGWAVEMQQLQGQLAPVMMRALQDPKLQSAQKMLGQQIKTAMEKEDPGLIPSMERVQRMESEARAAQQKGDRQRLLEIMQEVQQVQMRFLAVQQRVVRQPAIAGRMAAFQTSLEQRMAALEPASAPRIKRYHALEDRVKEAVESVSAPE